MKLSVVERVLLGGMMSNYQSNFTTLKLVRKGREVLSFTDDEVGKLNFVQQKNSMHWDPTAALEIGEVEIGLSETMISIIKTMLTKLNDEEKLTEQHFSLYEKFIL